ncbi:XdhC family protein [Caenimonas soli]|uniref:XdhC family protein n=1 Tax=Caenimonas soli TaxID=2735555 RepID=UPI00155607A3|nr:XdhC family protein [Caenimonas soli]NPC57431.1 XdhC family protein [Caenimonas soli]
MDSLDLRVLAQGREWLTAGHSAWLVTVVEAWGSAPRPPGALLCLRHDGLVAGSVSGGCVEDDLIHRVRHGNLAAAPQMLTYGVTKEEAARFGLPCGGTLRLLQEPLVDAAWIDDVLAATARHELVARVLEVGTGRSRIEPASRGELFSFDGATLRAMFGPRWRLLLIGAGQLSQGLAEMALALDFDVTCCDPREEYHLAWDVKGTHFNRGMPDDVVLEMDLDPHSAVVALTHDRKLDDMALIEALKSPAFYVGALGSRINTAARKERMALFDLATHEIARLHGPVGLDLGSRTPAEIAVSVIAEIVAVRNGVPLLQKKPALPAVTAIPINPQAQEAQTP